MASVLPFHSTRPSTVVYHDNTLCKEGNKIKLIDKKSGTAERPKCHHCSKLW